MKKKRLRVARALMRLGAILAGGVAVGYLLLVAAYALPTARIAQNVRLSVQSLDGSWETGEIPYEQLVKGYLTAQLDNTTDATMLLAAAHDNDQPLLQRAANVPTYTYRGMYTALIEYGKTGTTNLRSANSARYWLGFLVWLKPLLLVASYMDIRMMLMSVQLLLLCAVVAAMARRGLQNAVPALAVALLAITPAVVGFSMQFSSVYMLMLLGMLVLLLRPRLLDTGLRAASFFLLMGMATSYFDYLTYPIATFGLPFLTALLLRPAVSMRESLTRLAALLAAWLVGYFGMWAGKWVIAAFFGGDPWFWPNLFAKVAQRGAMQSEGAPLTLASVYASVLRVFAKRGYLLPAAALCVGYAAMMARHTVRRKRNFGLPVPTASAVWRFHWPAVAVTGLLPFVWYACTANHTVNHAFFTSRALVVSGFALALLLCAPFLPLTAPGKAGAPAPDS